MKLTVQEILEAHCCEIDDAGFDWCSGVDKPLVSLPELIKALRELAKQISHSNIVKV